MDVVRIPSLASHPPQPVHLFGGTTLSPVGGCCVVSDSPAGDGLGGSLFLSWIAPSSCFFFSHHLSYPLVLISLSTTPQPSQSGLQLKQIGRFGS